MDKKQRNLLIGSVLAAPLIINKLVFFLAGKKYPMLDAFHTYEWRLGKIGYSVKGSGKPVVLIHGAVPGSSSAVWTKNVNSLSESYKVYSLDLLGYGTSERAKTTYTAYTYASMIDDFITQVVGKPAAVIAEGEGAMFAAAACIKNPDNYKKLVFVCPKGIDSACASNRDKKKRLLYELPVIGESLYLMNVSFSAVRNRLLKMIYNSKKTKILTDRFYSAAHFGGGRSRYVFASYKTNFMNTDIKPYLSEFRQKTLVIWGEKAADADCFYKIQEIMKEAQYALFEETANLPNYENSEEFNKLVKEFLK